MRASEGPKQVMATKKSRRKVMDFSEKLLRTPSHPRRCSRTPRRGGWESSCSSWRAANPGWTKQGKTAEFMQQRRIELSNDSWKIRESQDDGAGVTAMCISTRQCFRRDCSTKTRTIAKPS